MNGITREMVFLCIGDDLQIIDSTELKYKIFEGIKYYVVSGFKVIERENQMFCSCNYSYCWHIFKVVLDKEKAIKC